MTAIIPNFKLHFMEMDVLNILGNNADDDIEIVLEEDLSDIFLEDFIIPELPSIAQTSQSSSPLCCRFCLKSYRKLYFFEKHRAVCQGLTTTTVQTKKTPGVCILLWLIFIF